jgi:hypothetical protein
MSVMTMESGAEATSDPSPLVQALWHTPIPTAPPASSRRDGAFGLHLLAAALRLHHVARLSESLVLVDSTHLARTVSIDLNLETLTADQRDVLRKGDPNSNAVWLPLARQARTWLAPVVVRDGKGEVLPRFTGSETSHLIAGGLTRLFRLFLDAHPRTSRVGTPLHALRYGRHRARWLIEAAITDLVDHGPARSHVPATDVEREAADPTGTRAAAHDVIEELFPADSPFLELLDVAANEYILVARVPLPSHRVFVQYEAPMVPAGTIRRHPRWFGRRRGQPAVETGVWHARLPWRSRIPREFTLKYETIIPRAVNSYHVTLTVPEEIQVRRFILQSDVDAPYLHTLAEDMDAVARQSTSGPAIPELLLEHELESMASRMAEFGRRRLEDLAQYEAYLRDYFRQLPGPEPWAPRWRRPDERSAERVLRQLASGHRPVTALTRFADLYQSATYGKLATATSVPGLRKLARTLEEAGLGCDVYVDNDPRENAGHAQWRRRTFGDSYNSAEPVTATVYAALVDDPPSLASSVYRLLLAVFALVAGFGVILYPDLFGWLPLVPDHWKGFPPKLDDDQNPLSSADAVVTTLLLVPGLMLSRLDIPSHKTVLGRLRSISRYLAYASVLASGALALCVAAMPKNQLQRPVEWAVWILLLLIGAATADGLLKATKRRTLAPNYAAVPGWLVWEMRWWRPLIARRRPRRRPVVEFSTIGEQSRV